MKSKKKQFVEFLENMIAEDGMSQKRYKVLIEESSNEGRSAALKKNLFANEIKTIRTKKILERFNRIMAA